MRVVVWNMRKATKASPAWEYLLELAPDLALLQEVGSVPETVGHTYQRVARRAARKTEGSQKFSTAVLAKGEVGPSIPLSSEWTWVNQELGRFAGNLVAELVTLANRSCLRALSAYSPAWPVAYGRLTGVDISQVKLLHSPDVWVTELLWAALRGHRINEGPPWLVGGDLNCSETFDDMWPHGPHGNREVLDRMGALGLTECLRHVNGDVVPTFRNPRGGKVIHQMDHLFVSGSLLERLTSCETGDADRVFKQSLSDHLPIIADFTD
jgi:hypothetical protein